MSRRRRQQNLAGQFRCPRCDTWKYPMEFYTNTRTLDGISSRCKDCHKEVQRYYSQSETRRRFEERERLAQLELKIQTLELQNRKPIGPPVSEPTDDFEWPEGIDELVAPYDSDTPHSS